MTTEQNFNRFAVTMDNTEGYTQEQLDEINDRVMPMIEDLMALSWEGDSRADDEINEIWERELEGFDTQIEQRRVLESFKRGPNDAI